MTRQNDNLSEKQMLDIIYKDVCFLCNGYKTIAYQYPSYNQNNKNDKVEYETHEEPCKRCLPDNVIL